MACSIIQASSVALTTTDTETYITITVPDTTTFGNGFYRIALNTTIPTSVNCARIAITNGTDTANVLKCNGNYWRPCQLKCQSVLRLRYLTDPVHFMIIK